MLGGLRLRLDVITVPQARRPPDVATREGERERDRDEHDEEDEDEEEDEEEPQLSSLTAATMCRAEIPAASRSSAGLPEPGISRTARWR